MSTLPPAVSKFVRLPKGPIATRGVVSLLTAVTCLTSTAALRPSTDSDGRSEVEDAVARSVPLMQRSMATWFDEQGCLSCHHQGLGMMAVSLAKERGFAIDQEALDGQAARVRLGPEMYAANLGGDFGINPSFGMSFMLLGRAATGAPSNGATDALAHHLAGNASDDGAYYSESHRPPLEDSPVTSTALASRALLLYGSEGRSAEIEEKVGRSRRWLEAVVPRSNEERVMRLLGLGWTGAKEAVVRDAARELESEQRPDGGWAQIPTLESDAYATGQALVALQQMGGLAVDSETYERGVRFLLACQHDDGSWLVETRRRSPGIPYFESGFPHRTHQFISFAGTAWATMALCLTIDPGPSDVFHGPRPERDPSDTLASDAGMREVHLAAAFGTPEELQRILEADPSAVDAAGPGGLTPLMLALHDDRKVELLLDAGADIAAKSAAGTKALELAGWYSGAGPALGRLLERGASLDSSATDRALVLAVRTGERDKVERLLEHGADVDAALADGRTALQCAAVAGDLDLLELLLEHGADVDARGFGDMTALSAAVHAGWTDLVAALVAHGAALETKDVLGMTPLAWAAKIDYGHDGVLSLLLEAGADPSIVSNGRTPRAWAEMFDNRLALALLADEPAPPNDSVDRDPENRNDSR